MPWVSGMGVEAQPSPVSTMLVTVSSHADVLASVARVKLQPSYLNGLRAGVNDVTPIQDLGMARLDIVHQTARSVCHAV